MKKSLKVIFFGNESLATGAESNPLVLRALIENGYDVCAVVVHERTATSRKAKKVATVVYAEEQNIPLYNPDKPLEIADDLRSMKADIGVLVAYGRIIPQEIIDIFPLGIINLHPSLLPKLRGPTPIETAILEGLSETGVSIMKLVKQMDAGPVYAQESIVIEKGIPKQKLANSLHILGVETLLKVLGSLDNAEAAITEQVEPEATFCSLLSKTDGLIDWSEPADVIDRKVRAYSGWPKTYCELNGKRYVVCAVKVDNTTLADQHGTVVLGSTSLGVQTGQGVIYITSIQPENKGEMPIKAFLAGYRDKIS